MANKSVPIEKRNEVVRLMVIEGLGQHDISNKVGVSRPYIKMIADQVGYIFPRYRLSDKSKICMCRNCGQLFKKPVRKINGKSDFCNKACSNEYKLEDGRFSTGQETALSILIRNQVGYEKWRRDVLQIKDRCLVSNRQDNIECYYIINVSGKKDGPNISFNINNGIVLNRDIYQSIFRLVDSGMSFEKTVETIKGVKE